MGLLREQTAGTAVTAQDDRRLGSILADRQSRSQAFFSSAAGQWDRMRREMFGERFDLLAIGGLLDESWVLGDLACGTGQIAEALAPFVQRVIAVDRSRAMLKAAKKRLGELSNVEVRQGELEALPIDACSSMLRRSVSPCTTCRSRLPCCARRCAWSARAAGSW